jgi:hypothetical protein
MSGLILPAAAQTANWESVQALPPGIVSRVRLTGDELVQGQLGSVSDDRVVLYLKDAQRMLSRREIAQLSVKKKGHRARNALLGFGIGALGGLAVGAAADARRGHPGFVSDKALCTPLGAIGGAIVGAVLPTGGWRTVYERR